MNKQFKTLNELLTLISKKFNPLYNSKLAYSFLLEELAEHHNVRTPERFNERELIVPVRRLGNGHQITYAPNFFNGYSQLKSGIYISTDNALMSGIDAKPILLDYSITVVRTLWNNDKKTFVPVE